MKETSDKLYAIKYKSTVMIQSISETPAGAIDKLLAHINSKTYMSVWHDMTWHQLKYEEFNMVEGKIYQNEEDGYSYPEFVSNEQIEMTLN